MTGDDSGTRAMTRVHTMIEFHRREHEVLGDAVDAAEWDAALVLIDQHWSTLIATDTAALRAVLAMLPDDVLGANPRYLAARSYLDHLAVDGENHTQRYRHDAFPDGAEGLFDVLVEHTSRAAAARSAGRVDESVSHVVAARAVLVAADPAEVERIQATRGHVQAQWARVHEFAAQSADAIAEYQDVFDLAMRADDALLRAAAASSLAWLHTLSGHTALAERWLTMTEHVSLRDAAGKYRVPALLAQALGHADRLEWTDAAARVRDAEAHDAPEYWAALLYVKSRILPLDADPQVLLTEIDVALMTRPEVAATTGLNAQLLLTARVDLLLRTDQVANARAELRRVAPWVRESARAHLVRAHIDLAAGEFRRAALAAETVIRRVGSEPRLLVKALALLAVASGRLLQTDAATDAASRTFALARAYDLPGVIRVWSRDDLTAFAARCGLDVGDELVSRVRVDAGDAGARVAPVLTVRENAVLAELVTGATTTEIAARLFVSPNTVKSQLRSAYRKLGATTRAQAEAEARRLGLGH